MEKATDHYSIHPVIFDADILCDRCRRDRATHYMRGDLIVLRELRTDRAELCDKCTEHVVSRQLEQTTWALME